MLRGQGLRDPAGPSGELLRAAGAALLLRRPAEEPSAARGAARGGAASRAPGARARGARGRAGARTIMEKGTRAVTSPRVWTTSTSMLACWRPVLRVRGSRGPSDGC